MPISSNAEQNRPAGLEESAPKFSVPWRVASVRVLPNFRLEVTFVDGVSGIVDAFNLVHANDAGVFAVLRDGDIFAKAHVDYGAVTWPGNLDLAPDAMYDEIKKHGVWVL